MKYLVLLLTCLLLSTAQATLITETHDITASGEGSVGYTYFEVTTEGLFDIYTDGPTIDPFIFLFYDDGQLSSGDFLVSDDDDCLTSYSFCNIADGGRNAFIDDYFLDVGFYVVAVSDFSFDQDEAVSGLNVNNRVGLVDIIITSDNGDAVGPTTDVPEPTSIALIALALIGFSTSKRKKNR